MINSRNEVDLAEAVDMLDVSEEVLGKLAEEGKLKSRRADGTIYFLREQIDEIIDREIEEERSKGTPSDFVCPFPGTSAHARRANR
jgi:hypothetical protein